MTQPEPDANIQVNYDEDDQAVTIQFFDPIDSQFGMPVVDFICNEDEAHELEKQLREFRLARLGLEEVCLTSEEVRLGDIIADLGMTIEDVDKGSHAVDLHQYGNTGCRVVVPHGVEFKVNRRRLP